MSERRDIPFRNSHGLVKVDSVSQSWNGIQVRYFEKHPGPGQAWADMSSDLSTLVVCLDQRGGFCEGRLKLDTPTYRTRYDAGFAVWVPENRTVWGFSENARLVRDVRLMFDMERLGSILGDDFDSARVLEPTALLYDSRVTQCANLLADACVEPATGSRLYGESLTMALLAAYWSHQPPRTSSKKRTGGLSPWQLRRTTEYLHEHFAQDVSLASLAEMSGLSQSQFGRAFRASTGASPYQWALRLRVLKGQELLLKSSLVISSIAVEVGFSDQSHFTKAFRRVTGITPKRWQRDRRRKDIPEGNSGNSAAGTER